MGENLWVENCSLKHCQLQGLLYTVIESGLVNTNEGWQYSLGATSECKKRQIAALH